MEILPIASDGRYGEVHRRSGGQWVIEIVCGDAALLTLTTVGLAIPLAEL